MVGVFFCRLRAALAVALLAALFVFGFAAPSRAGDAASLNMLGFAPDGSVFAFEEYGIQDGSGFPYANRFYIDTADDSFLPGTPIRVRLDDETASVDDARAEARSQGQAVIADDELAQNPGFTAGLNPITELSADPFHMTVNPRPVNPPIDPPIEVRLTELNFPAEGSCAGVTDTVKGFRLVQLDTAPGGTTRLLNEDDDVPGSRGCPLGYSIGGVQTFFPDKADPVFAVLIAVRSFGFEGPDFRWMAVTAPMTQ